MKYDVIVIGAGAAGLMAAATAAKRGKKVILLESTAKVGEKIRISGGGRCNFTNLEISSKNYLSQNPHFAKSALAQYSQHDFIKLVESYGIKYHEKKLGQLFCDGSSIEIINMLLNECKLHGVDIKLNCQVRSIRKSEEFILETDSEIICSDSLIIATGGLSIPKIGATDFGYRIAAQFGIEVVPLRPALVPLIASDDKKDLCCSLSGVSLPAIASYNKTSFKENILFTHKGLSGPAILQISTYLDGKQFNLNLIPEIDLEHKILAAKSSKSTLFAFLKEYLPKRFVDSYFGDIDKKLAEFKNEELKSIVGSLANFKFTAQDTEGYAKAEVTAGGVDTSELFSQTMESRKVKGLYFVGEVVDVTGWLGGCNFQWAWSSGYVAGSNA